MENDDTVSGGEALSIEQAASAFVKATSNGAGNSQPEEDAPIEGEQADELQASEEGEGESEGESDAEGQSEEGEEGEEPDSDLGRFVAANGKVRLPDGTVSTVADLIQGNLRDRDYRQKTMATAEEKRALAEQSSAFEATKQQVNEQREYMAQLLESITPKPPDPELLQSDPIGYMQQKAQHEQFAAHLQYIQHQLGASKAQTEEQARKERDERANAEMEKLKGAVPELKDDARLRTFAEDIKSAGLAAGYTLKEIAEAVPYDHRMALVLQKAARWDRLQASKPKAVEKVQGRPPVQKGGKRLTPDAIKAQHANEALNRLKQTGTVEDAARAYLASRRG
ncbi:MAG TPA: hypothetical protein VEG32_07815 [Clostridia bacterium]|nr:hypothetical protein [Clostridia bacterium]